MNQVIPRRAPSITANGGFVFKPRFTAAVLVKSVHIKDKFRSTPGQDYVIGYLTHSVPGLEAKFDSDGKPITRVCVTHEPPPPKGSAAAQPVDLFMLSRGGRNVPALVMWQTIIFENCMIERRDPSGQGLPTFCCKFISIGPTAVEQGKQANPATGEYVMSKRVLTFPALVLPRTVGKDRTYQKICLANPNAAVEVRSEEELVSVLKKHIDVTIIGYPGYLLISRRLVPNPKATLDEAVNFALNADTRMATFSLPSPVALDADGRPMPTDGGGDHWGQREEVTNGGKVSHYRKISVEELLQDIKPDHRAGALWLPGWQHTMVPLMGFPQSLFKREAAGFDPSNHYRYDENGYGFASSIVTVVLSQNGSGGWVSPFQKPINSCGEIITPEEMITADMPEYHRIAAQQMLKADADRRLAAAAEASARTYAERGARRDGPAPTSPQVASHGTDRAQAQDPYRGGRANNPEQRTSQPSGQVNQQQPGNGAGGGLYPPDDWGNDHVAQEYQGRHPNGRSAPAGRAASAATAVKPRDQDEFDDLPPEPPPEYYASYEEDIR